MIDKKYKITLDVTVTKTSELVEGGIDGRCNTAYCNNSLEYEIIFDYINCDGCCDILVLWLCETCFKKYVKEVKDDR